MSVSKPWLTNLSQPETADRTLVLYNFWRWIITTLILSLLIFPSETIAQSRNPGTVTGRIVDGQSSRPVEYANVVLLDTITRKMATGTVSDSNGMFRLTDVPAGVYFLEYSFIGYDKKRSPVITIDRKRIKVDLGTMMLQPSSVAMNEVTITGERNMMITRIDRKVFNVTKDLMAQSGTVSDMLQNIPSVSVDIDGNISLRGSGNVTILINGRPSLMTSAANLEQMPAALIEKIEVITNPSARYKPDGTAGIINIILKKERKAGFNGILGANAGNNSRFNTNLQLNYNTNRINIFGSYGYRQDYRLRSSELSSQVIDTVTGKSVYLQQSSSGTSWPSSHLGQLGIDWTISSKDAIGISGTINYRQMKRGDISNSTYLDDNKTLSESFTRNLDGKETEPGIGVTSWYEHVFDREKEHQFRLDFEYQQDSESEDDVYTTDYSFPSYPQDKEHSINGSTTKEFNLQAGYSRPLWADASLEAGYEGNMDIDTRDQQIDTWDPDKNQWIENPDLQNRYYGRQTIHALYATLNYSWKKFAVMGGLRAEQTYLTLEFITLDTLVRQEYFALYPTLHMGLTNGKSEFQINYSRRVNRPDPEDMNPVPEYRDPRNFFVGNPDLKPEDIHSFELGYSFRNKGLTVVPTLFYRYKINGFTWVTSTVNDTVFKSTIENLDTDQSAGLDLSGTWSIGKVANINFSASGFYNQIDASAIGYSDHLSAFSWNAKVNGSVSITPTTILQVNGQYRSKVLTAQGYRLPTWVVNLGFRQDLWKKKVSLLATVSDIFNSQINKTIIETRSLVQESTRRRDSRVFYLGAVFNFGVNGKKSKEPKFEFDNRLE